eukprot:jgi/Pico_ML_1/50818/g1959.t2
MVESQKMFAEFTQEQVDHIFHQVALEANMMRLPLAQYAVQETKRGIVEDKVIKNHFASEFVYNKYKDAKTAGIIEEDVVSGLTRIAEPVGPVGGVTPVTNPTSTVIYYCLMALKTRNCIVISPHPAAAKCSYYTAEILRRAAVKLGAPPDCIRCIAAERSVSSAMLTHKDVAFLWATGGPGIVNACYRSGKPAIGVGAGNAPALVDETCDMRDVAASIVLSKTFDNGMICASENAVVVVEDAYPELRKRMEARGCYFMNKEETEKNVERISMFEKAMPTYKVLVDMPSSFGAIGDVYNFRVNTMKSFEPDTIIAFGGGSPMDAAKVDALIARLEELKREVGIPLSLREAGVSEELFEMKLGTIAAKAFDDQCTGANPRYPLIGELIQLLREAYEGPPKPIQGSSISGSMSMSFSNGNGDHEGMDSTSEEGQEEHSTV